MLARGKFNLPIVVNQRFVKVCILKKNISQKVDLNLYMHHNKRNGDFHWAGIITPANPKLRA